VVRAGDFEIIGNSMVPNSTTQIDLKLLSLCGDVELSHSRKNRPSVETDRAQPPTDGFFLRCDRLTFDRKKPGLARLQAEGKVVFRSQVLLARSSTLKYDQPTQQIVLEGDQNNPARLFPHAETGGPPREVSGTKILYNRRTGDIRVEGAESSTPLPGGQLHESNLESQGEKDFAIAEYYRRTGDSQSARFYYSLVCRRYPSSSHADSALRMLRDMNAKLKGPGGTPKLEVARVGQVIIRGNDKVPDHVILAKLGVFPSEVLIYEDLRAVEKALAESGLFNLDTERGIRPTVRVLESDNPYKDILIVVQEK